MTSILAAPTQPPTQQLLLDLGPPPAPTLDNFIVGRNGAALAALRALAGGQSKERSLHLWGELGSGRSHLLRALASHGGRYIDCNVAPVPDYDGATLLWCVDDVEACDGSAQVALFNLINAVRATPRGCIVTAAAAPPLHIALPADREDLRTRLGWGPVYRIETLTDTDKQAALARHARERGIALAPEVARHLLTHFSRDMPALMRLIDALDRYALGQHRPLTLPLVRDYVRAADAANHAANNPTPPANTPASAPPAGPASA